MDCPFSDYPAYNIQFNSVFWPIKGPLGATGKLYMYKTEQMYSTSIPVKVFDSEPIMEHIFSKLSLNMPKVKPIDCQKTGQFD